MSIGRWVSILVHIDVSQKLGNGPLHVQKETKNEKKNKRHTKKLKPEHCFQYI